MKSNEKLSTEEQMAFGKSNYVMMAIGALVILIGFILMSGGASEDPAIFNEGVFSFRRLTLAPILTMGGFGLVAYAILKKPKK